MFSRHPVSERRAPHRLGFVALTTFARHETMKKLMASVLLVLVAFGVSPKANAAYFFETATGTAFSSGLLVDDFFWPAHRFELASPTKLRTVGGRFTNWGDPTVVFGAIVALTGPSDFPDSLDLTTPDVVGTTLVGIGADASLEGADRRATVSISLAPGWYALIFGAGQFGAPSAGSSSVTMQSLSTDLSPSQLPFTAIQAGNPPGTPPQFVYQSATPRFIIPEPSGLALLGAALAGLAATRRRTQ